MAASVAAPAEAAGAAGARAFAAASPALDRLLQANTAGAAFRMLKTASAVLTNVATHPEEDKYRVLKLSNAAISAKIVGVRGGVEVLLAAGFRRVTRGREQCLVLPEAEPDDAGLAGGFVPASERASGDGSGSGGGAAHSRAAGVETQSDAAARIAAARDWVARAMAEPRVASVGSGGGSGGSADEPLCRTCLQVRLADGSVAVGGFSADEKLSAVVDFVHSHNSIAPARRPQRRSEGGTGADAPTPITLSSAYPKREFTDEELSKTLEELGIEWRSTLVVSKGAREGAVSAFRDTAEGERRWAEEVAGEDDVKRAEKAVRRRQLEEARAEEREARGKALMAFKDDRVDVAIRTDVIVAGQGKEVPDSTVRAAKPADGGT